MFIISAELDLRDDPIEERSEDGLRQRVATNGRRLERVPVAGGLGLRVGVKG